METKLVFELGEQPTRPKAEANREIDISFIDKLFKESNETSLMNR